MTTNPTQARADIAAILAPRTHRGWRGRAVTWLLLAGLLAVTGVAAQRMIQSNDAAAAPQYVTEAVTRGDLAVTVSATGNLKPTNTVDVGSELSGLVVSVFVDDNETVKRGQVLAQLDPQRLQDQITQSEATLAATQARLVQTEATVKESAASLARLREVSRLSGGKVPSQTEMEGAEATAARADADRLSATASVAEARAALSSDRTNLSKASIRSPIDGIVLQRSVEPGQTVAASLQVATLFTIAEDLQQMELEVDVDEADVGRVANGQHATFSVDAYPARIYEASVTRVAYGATTSADVVSYATVLVVENDDLSLRPGMTASAEIATASVTGALLVPNGALRYTPAAAVSSRGIVSSLMPGPPRQGTASQTEATSTDGEKTLWVLRDGTPVAVMVAVGQTDGRWTEVTGGELREGDQVTTEATGAQS
ncbi:MAG: efflux RND transporter periplasmic adaptor subunit [Acidobacteria bacterium]|nr:efflux RND transporter periplasmic adaptor subunit [Acidobacteriota bacterium]